MEKPTTLALVGIVTGAVIATGGYIGLERSKARVSELVIDCQNENKRESIAVDAWRRENHVLGLTRMSNVEEYAAWIVANKEKKGTSDFEAVAKAYKMLRDGPLVCDPGALQQSQNESNMTGVKNKIVETQREGTSWFEGGLTLAGIVTLFAAIPYIWHFFLRRAREVRDAVAGK